MSPLVGIDPPPPSGEPEKAQLVGTGTFVDPGTAPAALVGTTVSEPAVPERDTDINFAACSTFTVAPAGRSDFSKVSGDRNEPHVITARFFNTITKARLSPPRAYVKLKHGAFESEVMLVELSDDPGHYVAQFTPQLDGSWSAEVCVGSGLVLKRTDFFAR